MLLALALCCPLVAQEVELADEAGSESYRISGVLRAPAEALASGEARVVFDWTDADNHYYVRLHQESAQIFGVKEGETTALSRAGGIRRAAPAERLEFSLQRRDWSVQFACNQVVCARAEDRDLPPGAAGHRGGPGLVFEAFEVQPTEPIYFADDFMRTDDQLGGWAALLGQWENNQQGSKTTRSANAFSFRSVGEEPSLAVTGYPFWTDYVAQAAVRCDGSGAIGLAVGVLGAEDHYRL
ncbi:MAG: hypothetical protein HUU35_19060, partial [Armatimonadetes bacterium]|nr:hypothetical protein [Armatimonadota bacterium]